MGLSKPVKIITQEVVVSEAAVDLSEVNAKLDTISENVDTTKTYASNVNSRFTSARASAIDTINTNAANAATNAANAATNASTAATNSAKLTDARMGYIDTLSNLTATRIKYLDSINTNAARLTSTRAGYIDKLANGVGGAMGHKITDVTTTEKLSAETSYNILSLTGAGEFYTIAVRNNSSNTSMTVWLDIYVDGVQLVPSTSKKTVGISGTATKTFGMMPYADINHAGLRLSEDADASDTIIPVKFKQSLVIKMYVVSTNNSTANIKASYALQ